MNGFYDLRQYWQHVRRIERELPPGESFWVTKGSHGAACQCSETSRENAAVMLANGSARLATPEEIAAWQRRQAIRTAARTAAETAGMKTAIVSLGGK